MKDPSSGKDVPMMSLDAAMAYADGVLHDTMLYGRGSLLWMSRNDQLTRSHMATCIRRGLRAEEALKEALRHTHLEWRAPAIQPVLDDEGPGLKKRAAADPIASSPLKAEPERRTRNLKADRHNTVRREDTRFVNLGMTEEAALPRTALTPMAATCGFPAVEHAWPRLTPACNTTTVIAVNRDISPYMGVWQLLSLKRHNRYGGMWSVTPPPGASHAPPAALQSGSTLPDLSHGEGGATSFSYRLWEPSKALG